MKVKDKYDSYCSVCGFAITVRQIGAMIESDDGSLIVDFNDKCFIDLSMHICTDCWEKIKGYTLGGMKDAVAKSERLKLADVESVRK